MTRRRTETKVEVSTDKSAWHPSPLVSPLVLVSSRNSRGEPHVARKSWISMVSADPPTLVLSCRLSHRTAINILETREFVVNVPGEELAERAWRAVDHPGAERPEEVGWSLVEGLRGTAPRIQECRAHIECALDATRRVGDEDIVFFARILSVSLDESLQSGPPADRYRLLKSLLYLEADLLGVVDAGRRPGP
jgi:flavin reductase (DIM6/NTAB) family NADH-FMN oxidoreductase RutF